MKKCSLALFFLTFLFFPAFSQKTPDSLQLRPFLFDSFSDGVVLMKSGTKEPGTLNYNSDNQTVYFTKDGGYFILAGLDNVDSIYIRDKKFVAVNDIAYEVLAGKSEAGLVVSYSNKLRPMVATTDNNGTSRKNANEVRNTISDNYVGRIYKSNFSIEFIAHYWLKKGTRLYKFDTEKQVIKLYWKKENEIREFIKQQKINFYKQEDVIRLFQFCETDA
jgi:hypothetical protein